MFALEESDFVPQLEDIVTIGELRTMAAGGQIIFT
jgi:hypothetical protein